MGDFLTIDKDDQERRKKISECKKKYIEKNKLNENKKRQICNGDCLNCIYDDCIMP